MIQHQSRLPSNVLEVLQVWAPPTLCQSAVSVLKQFINLLQPMVKYLLWLPNTKYLAEIE